MKGLTSIAALFVLATCDCYSRSNVYLPNSFKVKNPSSFRPGPKILRPSWFTHNSFGRSPYFSEKSPSRFHKPMSIHMSASPWRTPMLPSSPTTTGGALYDYIRASPSALPPISVHGERGPIRTIPAPDLSLSQKPIVVADSSNNDFKFEDAFKLHKPAYEVTEKTLEPTNLTNTPQGFSHNVKIYKAPNLATSDFFQMLGSPNLQYPFPGDAYHFPILQQPQVVKQTALGPRLTFQAFNAIMQPSLSHDPNMLQQNVLFKPDPSYASKLQNQFYPRFPIEVFHPFPSESYSQTNLYLPDNNIHHNVIRHASENILSSVSPVPNNKVINADEEGSQGTEQNNITTNIPSEETTAAQTVTQVPNDAVSVIPNGVTITPELTEAMPLVQNDSTIDNSTLAAELKPYFISTISSQNQTDSFRPVHGSPFSKDGVVNTTYTFVESESKITAEKGGAVLAGQVVEGSVLVDEDFEDSKTKENLAKAAIRLRMPLDLASTTETSYRSTFKTRKTNLKKHSFSNRIEHDEKTGEPVIRIYAKNYRRGEKVSSSTPKATLSRGHTKVRLAASSKDDVRPNSLVRNLDSESEETEPEYVAQFGLKLRSRMDNFLPFLID